MKNSELLFVPWTYPHIENWVDSFLAQLKMFDVNHTPCARNLLIATVVAQLIEGPIKEEEKIIEVIRKVSIEEVATLYRTKYYGRQLTYNRAIRLLSDLHELWLDVR